MDKTFEDKLDDIFVESWKHDLKSIGVGAGLGALSVMGLNAVKNNMYNNPSDHIQKSITAPSPQVDIHREYPKTIKKADDKQPHEVEKEEFPISDYEINILASTLILEAGGEPEKTAMPAVMNVIHNRSKGDPKKYAKVALKPMQFSCHNNKQYDKNIERAKKHTKWQHAVTIVRDAVMGRLSDVTGGADHYHVYRGPSQCSPSWTHPTLGGDANTKDGRRRAVEITKYIGDHVFLKNVNGVAKK